MKYITLFLILSISISCSNSNTETTIISNPLTDSLVLETDKPMNTQFISVGDSIIIPEFEIELKLSEKAEKKLKSDKESIIVQAYFSGIPKDTTLEDYIEWGKISIGDGRVELFDKRIARFENIKMSKKTLDELSDKNFEVLINVFSGRRSCQTNLLSTEGILEEGIDSVKGKKFLLKGSLISGE